ncbi:WhiB family transcriptional regulator [Lentzea jiangxiensis]|uniref:Transcriptional regulator WhiB n=1 Tax=Lentzea jiangxiensis TaxID=641025 RepID=A0A1H0V152_9PSEU|nr:WhiB family transcriptional regulator [Lentzea jiangxiensis]SDP72262.1 WhiB family transcriptional regulator, redox-sensing transcriptional regulator [Lentzea jiangxiensis]
MTCTTRLPKPVTEVWDWQMEGLCRGQNSAVFFHPDNERGYARAAREEKAKAICGHCPVLQQCRAHALEAQEPYGVWGGMGEDERRQIVSAARRRVRAYSSSTSLS